ncbi:hypothetical protein M0R45_008835 [Rubus argutus]|uniref:Uncharacterized protein n=1 Tax=Rubus argutus TaxID=59490 RepID=A0AAW1Y2W0_RUBAR
MRGGGELDDCKEWKSDADEMTKEQKKTMDICDQRFLFLDNKRRLPCPACLCRQLTSNRRRQQPSTAASLSRAAASLQFPATPSSFIEPSPCALCHGPVPSLPVPSLPVPPSATPSAHALTTSLSSPPPSL